MIIDSDVSSLRWDVQYDEMYKRSVEDPDGFWGDVASTFFWKKKWPTGKDGKLHSANIDVRNGRVAVEAIT